jgi:hypothetical protein
LNGSLPFFFILVGGGGRYDDGGGRHYRSHGDGGQRGGRGGRYQERGGGLVHSGGRYEEVIIKMCLVMMCYCSFCVYLIHFNLLTFLVVVGMEHNRDGGRGRGGRASGPDLSKLSSVQSNVMMANVSPNFQFFLYSVQIIDSEGNQIESRLRRKVLFDLGLWDGLLKGMSMKEKDDLKRVVFFQGSFFYAARKIPGLEAEKLPLPLHIPVEKAEGDSIQIMQLVHYVSPIELQYKDSASSSRKEGELSFDKRCADCTTAFKDSGDLLQHW